MALIDGCRSPADGRPWWRLASAVGGYLHIHGQGPSLYRSPDADWLDSTPEPARSVTSGDAGSVDLDDVGFDHFEAGCRWLGLWVDVSG